MQRITFRKSFKDHFDVVIIDAEEYDNPHELVEYALKEWVEILLIDYYMTEKLWYNADDIEKEFKKINPHFPFLIVTSELNDAFINIDNPSIVYSKSIWEDNSKELPEFKTKLEKIIEKYQAQLTFYQTRLDELMEKLNKEWLTPEEEDEYVKVNTFISEVNWIDIPKSFFSVNTNKKLDEIIEKTEILLAKLEKNE